MSRGYKLSEGSVRSINATIRTVNQMRKTGIAGDLPFRQNQKRQQRSSGATLQIGKTTAEWTKGDTQDITPTDTNENATGDAVTVLNLFANVKAGGWCAFMKSGDTYILLAAECDEG